MTGLRGETPEGSSGSSADGEPRTATEMFERRVDSSPDAPFLLTADGRVRTYAEVATTARTLGAALRAGGVHRGDVVGLYSPNEPCWVVAMLATWWLGASIAACGALTPPAEASRRFELVKPHLVLVAEDLWAPPGCDAVRITGEGAPLGVVLAPLEREELERPDPDDVAAIFYTSGTAGEAKPIVHVHRRVAEGPRMTAGAYSRSPSFRPQVASGNAPPAISFNPFGHVACMGRMVFRMYVGRPLLLVVKFDVEVLRSLAERYELDTLQLTPAMVHTLAYVDPPLDLHSLKYVNSGTAPLPWRTRQAFERRYGVPVLQAYGSTEGGVTALERYEDALAGRRGPGSVGRVPEGIPVRIVDSSGGEVPAGVDGEILGKPDAASSPRYLTSDGASPLPVDGEGWYHTGDVGHLDEHGILYVTGRLKEMMIVGGFNVYPGEVEDVIRQSPLVRDAVVVPLPDDRLGEVPVAGVVLHAKGDAPGAALDELCRQRLEAYKVPRRWFWLEELPLTPNGKLDRRNAAAMAAVLAG